MALFDLLCDYFQCCVNQVVKVMVVNLLEVVRQQGLETDMEALCFCFPSNQRCIPPLVVPPPCWRPLMAKPGYALDMRLPPVHWTITGGTGPCVLHVLG